MTRNGTAIYERHAKSCPAETVKARNAGAKCNCTPTYQVKVNSSRDGKRITKTFPTKTEAKHWQAEAKVEIRKGTRRAPTNQTITEALEELLAGMKDGSIVSGYRKPYKPGTIHTYGTWARKLWIPAIGTRRLADLTRPDLQRVVEQFQGEGVSAETLAAAISSLRKIYQRAIDDGELGVDPTKGLRLPAVKGPRDRIVNEETAAQLIAAVPERDQPIWATAFYAGLRLGEIQGLDWEHIEVNREEVGPVGWIHVERAWDQQRKVFGEPKTPTSRRRVPILNLLGPYLRQQWEMDPKKGEGLIFFKTSSSRGTDGPERCLRDGCERVHVLRGMCRLHWQRWQRAGADPADLPAEWNQRTYPPDPNMPFHSTPVQERADEAWEAAGFERVTLHVCRHTFASVLFARRVNPTQIKVWMGHRNLSETLDTYTKLIPGSEAESVELANAPLPKPVLAPRPRLQLGPGEDQ